MRKTIARTWVEVITLVLVTIFFVTALHSSLANAQITHFYGRGYYGPTSYLNYCSFYITIYSPNDQTTYTNTMLLKFNITWTEYPNFPIPALYGYYAYSIDKGPFVEVISNQSANDVFYQTPKNNFTLNPSFSYIVDISNLEKGYHNILINASLYHYNSYSPPPPNYTPTHFFFSMTTSPYKFLVGETTATPTASPTATPTPTVPEFPIAAIPPLFPTATLTPTPSGNQSPTPTPPTSETPSPTLSASSSPSASQQPASSQEPRQTAFPAELAYATAIATATAAAVAAATSYRKRKRKTTATYPSKPTVRV